MQALLDPISIGKKHKKSKLYYPHFFNVIFYSMIKNTSNFIQLSICIFNNFPNFLGSYLRGKGVSVKRYIIIEGGSEPCYEALLGRGKVKNAEQVRHVMCKRSPVVGTHVYQIKSSPCSNLFVAESPKWASCAAHRIVF